MNRVPIDINGFEAKFQNDSDPWNYAASPFEAYKRRILRLACGNRKYGRGLELACANGETTKVLAPLCLQLLAIDGSATAIAEAKRRTRHLQNVHFATILLPDGLPRQHYDLIVASEILYYLRPRALTRMLKQLWEALAPGGRLVCLHHVIDFNDAATRPAHAQEAADRYFRDRCREVVHQRHGRFNVSAFEKALR